MDLTTHSTTPAEPGCGPAGSAAAETLFCAGLPIWVLAGRSAGNPAAPGDEARKSWLLVLALALLALALRLPGLAFGLPAVIEDDSGVLVRQIEMVRDATPAAERDENWGLYPHLVAELFGRFAPDDAPRAQDDTLPELLRRASRTHVFARASILALALLAVPLTFLLARRFVGFGGALLATGFVATSLLFQCFSQEARPHAAAAGTALLALVAALRLIERGDARSFVFAGLAGGLALGTLQNNVLVVVPIAIACALRKPSGAHRAWSLATLALIAAGYAFFYPHDASDGPIAKLDAATRTLRFFGHNVAIGEFDARGFATVLWSLWSFETLACVLALVALAVWLVRARGRVTSFDWFGNPALFAVTAYAVVHLVAIGMYGRTYERFCLQLVPILAVLAAWGAERLEPRIPRAGAIVLLAWIVLGLWPATRLGWLRGRPLAQEDAAAWLAEHARPDERIALHVLTDVPLLRTNEALDADPRTFTMPWRGFTPWRRYLPRIDRALLPNERFDVRPLPFARPKEQRAFEADPDGWLRATGATWFVLPVQATREGVPLFHTLHAALERTCELRARFPTRADGTTDVVLGFEDRAESGRPHWTWNLVAGNPIAVEVIELWRMR